MPTRPRLEIIASTSAILVLKLFLISLDICVAHASDSITSNQSLSGDQKLFSVGGNFVLGFFTKDESSSKFYIGIWYKKVSELTPVWVANRATPVSDITKSLLHISPDGNLALLDQSKSLIWSTNTTIPSNSSTVAVLQDNGNLVLRDADNSANIFWQSFDNPTHINLPGSKSIFNKVTKVSKRLISWKNSQDPAPGLFSSGLQENNQSVLLWNMSKPYWTSGPWNGRTFSKEVPVRSSATMVNVTCDANSEEFYCSFNLNNNSRSHVILDFVMDVTGQLKAVLWEESTQRWNPFFAVPEAQCDVTALCGPFGRLHERKSPSSHGASRVFDQQVTNSLGFE
ncbi:G-type lectin S-receptor-like serine/threonine-protein kinase At2g19130 [Dioscorea cayenensis subsp. rotundata]|uniref:G-type lectin S-receptor-like serine/threonine-protein kinase At2g19130 n=1 Tax=Dioscorea cayennensis subsp. rotundata TaxID=55577 RepID=A0AB40CJW6_DIOCR|nr:G-type lectin S-receptor-like serine/threonine-protein kinase At2g19130 [Dioscorea cayenensis subsp. rotundata]